MDQCIYKDIMVNGSFISQCFTFYCNTLGTLVEYLPKKKYREILEKGSDDVISAV